ncbi:MAG: hypothetical protein Kow0089_21330 [Desulfobulbaceae bacterium]
MRRFLAWLLSVLFYGIYTLGVLVFLLWFLFPVESVKAWLESRLDERGTTLAWEIGELRLAWPLSLVAEDVRAMDREDDYPLLLLDEVKLRPDAVSLAKLPDSWPLSYRVKTMGGVVRGGAALARQDGGFLCSGEITGVRVADMTGLWRQLGRSGSGTLSGTFRLRGRLPSPVVEGFEADFVVQDGSMELLQPVFGLESLEFNRMRSEIVLAEGVVRVEKGKVDSTLFGVDFSGTITLADTIPGSGLDISGTFEPRPELLGSIREGAVQELIKGQLKEGRLAFRLTDTVGAPGLVFEGVAGVIDGIIQGKGKEQ